MLVKSMFDRLSAWFGRTENILAVGIVLTVLVTHLAIINRVDSLIYDEKNYIAEANIIIHFPSEQQDPFLEGYKGQIDPVHIYYLRDRGYDDIEAYKERLYSQHGPLSKLAISAGISLFGDNVWGWRVFPVLFGSVAVMIFYLISQRLTAHRWLPLIATFIFAFENMSFVMSGIGTLDAIAFTLMLASFLAYVRGRYIMAGLVLAFAALAKEMVVLGGGVILFHWLLTKRKPESDAVKFLVAAPVAYFLLLPLLDYIALRELMYPWDRIYNMLAIDGPGSGIWSDQYLSLYHASHPWQWVINPEPMVVWRHPTYEITTSWTLWALIIPAMALTFYQTIRHRRDSFCLFSSLWFLWLYLPWFIIEIVTDGIMYVYYFYPVVGSVCLAQGYVIWKLLSVAVSRRDGKVGWIAAAPAVIWMMAHFILFWIMAPVS